MRLLIVEDSATVIAYLQQVLAAHSDIEVLPPARDGRAGVQSALLLRPDVILMDLNLPELDGISAIKEILREAAIPIVVFSANLDESNSFDALQAGAVDLFPKPRGTSPAELALFERRLVRTLHTMKDARVVRRTGSDTHRTQEWGLAEVVLIGASTGGPDALRRLLSVFDLALPVPIVVVQHTYPGYEVGLARGLRRGASASVAADGDRLRPGEVLLCPADAHLVLERDAARLVDHDPGDLNPSVDRLFESAAEVYGARAIGILLTGMGKDGAAGLKRLKDRGALTITQRGDTCIVDGMPAAARALGASTRDLDLPAIAALLQELFRRDV